MKLNERLKEIVRIDREIDALCTETNVVLMDSRKPYTELHRQRAAHVTAIKAGAER